MLEKIKKIIQNFIKKYIVDDDPYEEFNGYNKKNIEKIESPFKDEMKKRGRPKKK